MPLADVERRGHCVSVRLNASELAWLDGARAAVRMQRGEYLRAAALGRLPRTIPEINRITWARLGAAGANLNQIARRLNGDELVELDEVRAALAAFRDALIGADDLEDGDDAGDAEGEQG